MSYLSEMQKMGVIDFVFEVKHGESKTVFFFPGFYRVGSTKGNLACQIYFLKKYGLLRDNRQLLDEVFVISRISKVEVRVISRS